MRPAPQPVVNQDRDDYRRDDYRRNDRLHNLQDEWLCSKLQQKPGEDVSILMPRISLSLSLLQLHNDYISQTYDVLLKDICCS